MTPNTLPGADPGASPWRALVIGVDAYPLLPSAQLNGCVRDASGVRQFLVERLGVPPERVRFLSSPAADEADVATAANIRAAFAALSAEDGAVAGEHVVLFYACHGVRLTRQNADGTSQMYYGLAAADLSSGEQGFENLVLDREINRLLRQLQRRGVSVTVIADTCNSGAATRSLGGGARERVLKDLAPLSAEGWASLEARHPALAPPVGARALEPVPDRVGGFAAEDLANDADFVVLAACQDTETAKEVYEDELDERGQIVPTAHGALTSSLMQALARVPDTHIKSLRWMDLIDDLSATVARRVAARNASSQRPALEGHPARPVFGGAWTPFAPGFTVRQAGDLITVEGGTVQGLEVGAELQIFPYETTDFDVSDAHPVAAVITDVTHASGVLALSDPAAVIGPRSRARLVRPGPSRARMRARLRGVPDELITAAKLSDPGVVALVEIVPEDALAHVELRPHAGEIPPEIWGAYPGGALSETAEAFRGARDGFALLRSDQRGAPGLLPEGFQPTPDDVIAMLPGAGPQVDALAKVGATARLGEALREGLLQCARYLAVRDRRGGDEAMRAMLSVRLRAGAPEDTPDPGMESLPDALIAATRVVDPTDGVHVVAEGEWLFLELRVLKATKLRLNVGVLLCSDDGNVIPVWPPPGERYTFDNGRTTYIGEDRFNPLFLNRRLDQRVTRWTLKVISYTAAPTSPPIDLSALALERSVQDVIALPLMPTRAIVGRPKPAPELPIAYTFDLAIAYTA